MPLTSRDLYGDLTAISPDQLESDEVIYKKLGEPDSPFAIEERLIAGRMQKVYKNIPESLRTYWLSSSESFAGREYIVFDGEGGSLERYTYRDIRELAFRAALVLQQKFQIRKGDRVGLAARNYPEFIITFWAIHLLGGVAVVMNAFHDGNILAFSARDVECRMIICDGERFERLKENFDEMLIGKSTLSAVLVLPWIGAKRVSRRSEKPWLTDNSQDFVYDWQTLIDQTRNATIDQLVPVHVLPEDHATILFTSGTTGKPKGVLSTNRQFLSCIRLATFGNARALLRRRRPLPPPPDPESLDQSSLFVLVPLFHTTGLQSGLTISTGVGNKLILTSGYKKQRALDLMISEKARAFVGIGFMARELILAGAGKLPYLGAISHGGSSSAKEIPAEARKHHENAVPAAGYGLTEANNVVCHIIMDDYIARPTAIGKPPLGVDLMLVNVDDKTGSTPVTEANKPGELWVKTPGRALGYVNRPSETAEAFLQDGWFRTGDMAIRDEEGFFYITGRMKDIIVRKGENIACLQIEHAANTHASVIESCAVGIPDDEAGGGEQIGVVCVLKDDISTAPTQEELINAMKKQLPKYAIPEHIWIQKRKGDRDPIPRNHNGKTLRDDLRKEFIKHLASGKATDVKAKL